MPSNFEQFKQQIDSAVELISQNKALDETRLVVGSLAKGTDLAELIDTQSLLERCNTVCEKYGTKKPTIRIIHCLACDDDGLISKCLSALPNVYLLSDVHPYTDLVIDKDRPKYAPTDIASQAHRAAIPKQRELADKLFKQAIDQVYIHITQQGGTLVLTENISLILANKNYTHNRSDVVNILAQDYEISTLSVIKNPVDVYEDLIHNRGGVRCSLPLAEYCVRFSNYLENFPADRVFSEEELLENPQEKLKSIAQALELSCGDFFECTIEPSDRHSAVDLIYKNYLKGISGEHKNELNKLNKKLYKYGINLITSRLAHSQIPGVELSAYAPINLKSCIKKSGRFVIVVAGMRHSGSTALFNILRLLTQKAGFDLFSCYSESLKFSELEKIDSEVVLIKTHEIRDDIRMFANIVITSIRDLRDTVASGKRRQFSMLERAGGAVEYARYNREIYDDWEGISNYQFDYNRFIDSPVEVVAEIQLLLGLSTMSAVEIYNEVASLPTDQYSLTLLSPLHITDPKRKETFETTLTREEIQLVEENNADWFAKHGFSV